MKQFVWLIIVVLFCRCSGEKKDSGLRYMDLAGNLNVTIDSMLSWNDLASSTEIIPLETTDSALLSTFRIVNVAENKIIGLNRVENRNSQGFILLSGVKADVRIFDTKGKFIRTIDRKGRGAQEYPGLITLHSGDDPLSIEIGDNRNLFIYDEYGEFIRRDTLDKPFFRMAYVGKGRFAIENSSYPWADYKYYLSFMDEKGKIEKELLPVLRDTSREREVPLTMGGALASVAGGALYKGLYSDTLYMITPEGEVSPVCVYGMGDYSGGKLLSALLGNPGDIGRVLNGTILVSYTVFTGDKWFLRYSFGDKYYYEVWGKDGEKPLVRRAGGFENNGLAFKFPEGGALNLWPQLIKDGKAYFIVEAYRAAGFVKGISEESNPVLIVVTLK